MAKRLSWAVRLERAEKRGKFTSQDIVMAGQWTSCAIGEYRNFPRNTRIVTGDDIIAFEESHEGKLGLEFMHAVNNDELLKAKRIYAEIHALPNSAPISPSEGE